MRQKGLDRKNVRSKNNRLSEPGYEYSVLCNLKENHWSIPVSIERAGSSSDNKYAIAVSQILEAYCCSRTRFYYYRSWWIQHIAIAAI